VSAAQAPASSAAAKRPAVQVAPKPQPLAQAPADGNAALSPDDVQRIHSKYVAAKSRMPSARTT
jgi:hypothetical protein